MARISINDLPGDTRISREEMKRISGGLTFITISGVDGESTDDEHENWIEVLSLSPSISRTNVSGSR